MKIYFSTLVVEGRMYLYFQQIFKILRGFHHPNLDIESIVYKQ